MRPIGSARAQGKGLLRMGYPAALNWILLAYAVITVAAAIARSGRLG